MKMSFTLNPINLSLTMSDLVKPGSPKPKRRKIRVACESCRAKKKKCDGAKPICSMCKISYDRKLLSKLKASKDGKLPKDVGVEFDCRYRENEEDKNGDQASGSAMEASRNGDVNIVSNSNANTNGPKSSEIDPALEEIDEPFEFIPMESKFNRLIKLLESHPSYENNINNTLSEISQTLKELQRKETESLRTQELSPVNFLSPGSFNSSSPETSGRLVGRMGSQSQYQGQTGIGVGSNTNDTKATISYGTWDKSVERILKWPIFDGKFDNEPSFRELLTQNGNHLLQAPHSVSSSGSASDLKTDFQINDLESHKNTKVGLLKIGNLIEKGNEKFVRANELSELALQNIDALSNLEPHIFAHIEQWVQDFILNVHTGGNLFLDTDTIQETASFLKQNYAEFPKDLGGSFLVESCNYEKDIQNKKYAPTYVMIIIVCIGILSSRYDPKKSRISTFETSLDEANENNKTRVAFHLYKLSLQLQNLERANVVVGTGNYQEMEFYGLWEIQFNLLLSIYKNFMMKPLEAWYHCYNASTLIVTFLELHSLKRGDPNYQLIQRIYWQCYKNETELRLYLSPIYSWSGIMYYKPPFKVRDLKIPANLDKDDPLLREGWCFYLTEVFVRPILNKISNKFYMISEQSPNSIEKMWQDMDQKSFVEIIQYYLKETGDLLTIFERFLSQSKLSVPLRCAEERMTRIKEGLCIPLLYHLSMVVPLPIPNYTKEQQNLRHIDYEALVHPYLLSFLREFCDKFFKIPDLIEFASERRHGGWYRLRDIYLSNIILMITYKKFGIFFFGQDKLKASIHKSNLIYNYWKDECPEMGHSLHVINTIYKGLPYIK